MKTKRSRRKTESPPPVDGLSTQILDHRRAIEDAAADFNCWKSGTGNGVTVGIEQIRGALASVLLRS